MATVDDKLEHWLRICEPLNMTLGQALELLRTTREFHKPASQPSSDEATIAAAYSQICDIIRNSEEGTDHGQTKDLMAQVGLDTDNRSNVGKIASNLRMNNDLQRIPGSPGHWIKRISHTNGHSV